MTVGGGARGNAHSVSKYMYGLKSLALKSLMNKVWKTDHIVSSFKGIIMIILTSEYIVIDSSKK